MKEKGAALKARLVENAKEINGVKAVSYTHLDVYKRQVI